MDKKVDKKIVTHFCWSDTPGRPRAIVKAVCGVLIERGTSDPHPTCPECTRILAEFDNEGKVEDTLDSETG